MAEAAEGKKKTEVESVKMSDGRTVDFAGKRKVVKSTIIDESKIESDGNILQIQAGAISIRMDFRNGETRTYPLPLAGESGIAKFAGHGGEQKFGDELAITTKPGEEPPSLEDMVVWTDDLNAVIQSGKWGKGRAEGGGGVAGASLVLKALMEVTGKDLTFVKDFLEKTLAKNEGLTRPALYKSFRNANLPTGKVIARLEAEKKAAEDAKAPPVDVYGLVADMSA